METAMNWTWFHKLGSPKWFYGISGKLLPWLSITAVLLIGIGLVWGLVFAPPDYQQGNSFRIIYIHVPAAMLAQSCYVMLAVCGIVGLVWKMKLADVHGHRRFFGQGEGGALVQGVPPLHGVFDDRDVDHANNRQHRARLGGAVTITDRIAQRNQTEVQEQQDQHGR
jgi:hypothetical protein